MLKLTRKCAEGVRIGDNIEVVIIKTGRNRVMVGIDAPAHVPISRIGPRKGNRSCNDSTQKQSGT